MDIHLSSERLKSWRDFVARYLLLVFGILTALAIDQWKDHRLQVRHATEARVAIEAELRANLKEVVEARASDVEARERLDSVFRWLIERVRARRIGDPAFMAELQLRLPELGQLRFSTPTLRHDAWDAAVATGRLVALPPDEFRRLSYTYAVQHDVSDMLSHRLALIGTSVEDSLLLYGMLNGDVDVRTVFSGLFRASNAMGTIDTNLESLERELHTGLNEPAPPVKPPAPVTNEP